MKANKRHSARRAEYSVNHVIFAALSGEKGDAVKNDHKSSLKNDLKNGLKNRHKKNRALIQGAVGGVTYRASR